MAAASALRGASRGLLAPRGRGPRQCAALVTCPSATRATFMSKVPRRRLDVGPCRVSPASRRVRAHSPRVSVAPSSRGKTSRGISAFVKRPRGKRLEVETLCLLREPAGRTWSGVSFAMSAPWGRSSRTPGPEHARGTRKWLVSFSKAAKSIRRPRLCLHPPETHLTRYLVISFLLFH